MKKILRTTGLVLGLMMATATANSTPPGGIAIASNGDLLVADFYNQRVQRLRADGSFVRQWGTTGKIGIRAS